MRGGTRLTGHQEKCGDGPYRAHWQSTTRSIEQVLDVVVAPPGLAPFTAPIPPSRFKLYPCTASGITC